MNKEISKILITGGTGFVGSNLASALFYRGYKVRVLVRKNSNLNHLKNLNVEYFLGDINDKSSLIDAIQDCDVVFHTAAIVAMWSGLEKQQYQTNVIGTKNIVEVALNAGVKRFVHTSSIATLGLRNDGKLIDEKTEFNYNKIFTYNYTKYLAEKEVMYAVEKGLPAIIVNPSIIIGPGDYNFHGGTIIKRIKHRSIPFYVEGGFNIAFIDDVIDGHINAALYGKIGEKYILGGNNLTIKDAFYQIAEIVGVKPPLYKIPNIAVISFAKIFDIVSRIFKIKPVISSNLAEYVGKYFWVSSEKAIKELNYKITPFKEAVIKTYQWYLKEGLF